MIPYTITLIDSVWDYLNYQKLAGFRSGVTDKTESGYPKIMAMGWCSHPRREIVILKKGDWKTRLWHELGHEVGLKHDKNRHSVMYPYFWRGLAGWKYIETIYYNRYGKNACLKMIENFEGGKHNGYK